MNECEKILIFFLIQYFIIFLIHKKHFNPYNRCSDGADRLREHWDSNSCAATNISTLEQCAQVLAGDHTEWRSSMVDSSSVEVSKNPQSGSTTTTVVSAVISSVLVLILLIIASGFLYIYGRRNPGGLAERCAMRLEASYKRFGILEEPGDHDQVELGGGDQTAKDSKALQQDNNNTISVSF